MKQRQITFRVGQQTYCLPLLMVGEFCPTYAVTPVAGVDERIHGVAHIRGASTVVLDMRRVMQMPHVVVSDRPESMLVVPQEGLCPEANRLGLQTYEEPVILEVDGLIEIVTLDEADRHPTPAHLDEPFYRGVHDTRGQDVIELDYAELIQFLARDFQEVY